MREQRQPFIADPVGACDTFRQEQMLEVLNQMEQGIVVWDSDQNCLMFNERIFVVLEISPTDLFVGMKREMFLDKAVQWGVITAGSKEEAQARFQTGQPFSFDRSLPSGKVISSFARPLGQGGYVVTFTDVTQFRKDAADLAVAKKAAEKAETKALKMLAKEQAWREEAKLLGDLDEWLQSCKSLAELFEVVTQFMTKLLPDTAGELYLYSNSRDVLDGACVWGGGEVHEHIAPDSCWALRRGRGYRYEAGGIGLQCSHVKDHPRQREVEHTLCVPIVAHGDTVGLMHVVYPENASDAEVRQGYEFALQCGEHISLAIANVKLRDELHDQSTRDALTRLYNRRYFLEAMRTEASMAARKRSDFSLLSFDADKFKSFNDNHGHDAGDMVLRAIADKMHEMFSDGATPCRFGGEEFSVLLPNVTGTEAYDVAEELRRAVEEIKIRYGSGELPPVTISIGVASFSDHGPLLQDIINAADRALYQAKKDGRNCVRAADAEAQ
ncbi:diguanylate cyclase [Shimia sp. R11_0]|uniref:diguanylate cyclase n=1 Tax=Shimia sp. R11_0 TaxID=2821096 RepID=UPI001ADCD6C1|nr:diguanylate cyclase [Shimia sp. R11_0]MBO9477456.1 diguanylate cyclase [Shimia sp. R11_0]